MYLVRYVIEDDRSLDRINVKNFGFLFGVSFEVLMVDSGMIDSDLMFVFGIMFE